MKLTPIRSIFHCEITIIISNFVLMNEMSPVGDHLVIRWKTILYTDGIGKSKTSDHNTRTKTQFLNSEETVEFESQIFAGQVDFFNTFFFGPKNQCFSIKSFFTKIFFI